MTATITTAGAVQTHPTAQKLLQILMELRVQFQERDELFEAAVLGLLSNLHVFILGDPGTAKSMCVREFFARIQFARQFEKQMAGDTPFESVAGPIDLVKFNQGKYTRRTTGTLIEAHFGMLDEIGRTNGVVADNLLTIMNERLFHEVDDETGESVRKVPLRCLMGGSNSLPTEENESAAAFFDRMPIRVEVEYIKEDENFMAMLASAGRAVPNPTTITLDEVIEAADVLIPAIPLPRDVLVAIAKLRTELRQDKSIIPSDRRWAQSMRLVRASAFLNGRSEATTEDLAVLRFTLWDLPQERDEVQRMTTSISNPMGDTLNKLNDRYLEIEGECRTLIADTGMAVSKKTQQATEQASNCNILLGEIDAALQDAKRLGYSTQRLEKMQADTQKIKQQVLDAMVASLTPAGV